MSTLLNFHMEEKSTCICLIMLGMPYFLVHGLRGVWKQREAYGVRGRSQALPFPLFCCGGAGQQQEYTQGHPLFPAVSNFRCDFLLIFSFFWQRLGAHKRKHPAQSSAILSEMWLWQSRSPWYVQLSYLLGGPDFENGVPEFFYHWLFSIMNI